MLNKARGNCIKVIRFRIRNSSDSICPESMIVYAMCTNNNMNEQGNMLFFFGGKQKRPRDVGSIRFVNGLTSRT